MSWSTILGQPVAVRLLQAHLRRGVCAQAYLFAGPAGVGKRLTAIELAKAINCPAGDQRPCDGCDSCRKIERAVCPDVHLLSPQGPISAVRLEDVKRVAQRMSLRPFATAAQVAIVDGADRLTDEAANSLLKALEEPASQARWILLTDQPAHVLPTIRSRCQAVRFQPLAPSIIETRLIEQHGCEPPIARIVSRLAQGSLARAHALTEDWQAHRTMLAQFGTDTPARWLEWEMPTERQTVACWVSGSVCWLRDLAVACVNHESFIHQDASALIRQQVKRLDPTETADVALRVVELWDAVEKLVSPRLIGALLREYWLDGVYR